MKLLVVEDEQLLAQVLKNKFEKSHYAVMTAGDGEAALSIAKQIQPDAIVLDLMLPKKDGFEVLQSLREDEALKPIPVVVISNRDEDDSKQRAFSLGAAGYLVKSECSIHEIVEKVKSMLSSKALVHHEFQH